MSNVVVLEPAEASPEVAAVYADFEQKMGFPAPPNFIKAQGHSLDVVKGTWGLVGNVLARGKLPRALKEMLFVAISHERRCRYCEAAHIACCRMLGVETATIAKLVASAPDLSPARSRDIVAFGVKCARDPQSLTAEDFATLRSHELSEGEVVEIISMSALAVYANIMADATGVEPDTMFSQL